MENAILIHSTMSDGNWTDLIYSNDFDFTEYPLLNQLKKENIFYDSLEYYLHKYISIPKLILKDLKRYDSITFECFEPLNDIGKEICKYFYNMAYYETLVFSHKNYCKGDNGIVCQYVFQQNSDNGTNTMNF